MSGVDPQAENKTFWQKYGKIIIIAIVAIVIVVVIVVVIIIIKKKKSTESPKESFISTNEKYLEQFDYAKSYIESVLGLSAQV